MAELTIGQLAKRAGVSTSMLRYYEEQGLVTPAGRTAAGYRLYAPEAEQTLLFIQRAQRLGFSLGDIRVFLERLQRGALPDETVSAVAEQRYLEIERQLTDLLVLRHEMGVFLLDFLARAANVDEGPADLYQRLMQRVCGHEGGGSQARATLSWLLDRTGCALANVERDELLAALAGQHVHIWRDGGSYRVLIPSHQPGVERALREIGSIEADCHAHEAPLLERTEEGFIFSATGEQAFLFAQLFLDLEIAETSPGSHSRP